MHWRLNFSYWEGGWGSRLDKISEVMGSWRPWGFGRMRIFGTLWISCMRGFRGLSFLDEVSCRYPQPITKLVGGSLVMNVFLIDYWTLLTLQHQSYCLTHYEDKNTLKLKTRMKLKAIKVYSAVFLFPVPLSLTCLIIVNNVCHTCKVKLVQ